MIKDMKLREKFYLHQGLWLSRLRKRWSLRLMNTWLRPNTNTSCLNEQFSYSAQNHGNTHRQRSSCRLLDRWRWALRCPETSVRNYHSGMRHIPKSEDLIQAVAVAWNHTQSYCSILHSQESDRLVGFDVPTFTFPHCTQKSHVRKPPALLRHFLIQIRSEFTRWLANYKISVRIWQSKDSPRDSNTGFNFQASPADTGTHPAALPTNNLRPDSVFSLLQLSLVQPW